ncbi:hypothetical protein MBLL_04193 [Methylobacterium bullatum]|uniref:Uncharacterized protein n=1 Tax=Methylobacterium bullatum TaxID=570505 RepID=A0A679KIG8_9HYPH|nr:hypothetical protein MBLL_04193 [Methylobacterium bullatum]
MNFDCLTSCNSFNGFYYLRFGSYKFAFSTVGTIYPVGFDTEDLNLRYNWTTHHQWIQLFKKRHLVKLWTLAC